MAGSGVNSVLRDIRISLSELFTGGGKLEPDQELLLEVLFGLLGYLARADSIVTSHETEFVNHLMDELDLHTRGRALALGSFERGRKRQVELSTELPRFLARYPKGSAETQRLYDTLVRLAAADGRVRPRERTFLEELTTGLGYAPDTLDSRLDALSRPAAE